MSKIMIGVPTAELTRRGDFYDCFLALDKPEGTMIMFARGQSPASNRNAIIKAALENECTHILFLDDDLIFNPDILHRLLKHDKDIITGLYLMRSYPHYPIVFDKAYEDGKCRFMLLKDLTSEVIEVENCGLGICLIKIEVFKSMQHPWITLGEIEKDGWCDDVAFFNKVRKLEFKIHCDLTTHAGHTINMTIWPTKVENGWNTSFVETTGQLFQIPQMTEYPSGTH